MTEIPGKFITFLQVKSCLIIITTIFKNLWLLIKKAHIVIIESNITPKVLCYEVLITKAEGITKAKENCLRMRQVIRY